MATMHERSSDDEFDFEKKTDNSIVIYICDSHRRVYSQLLCMAI